MNYNDLVNPKTWANDHSLHELLRHMRANDPVALVDADTHRPFYAISRHADIIEIARNHETFLNAPRPILTPRKQEEEAAGREVQVRTLINIDGDEHRALRALTRDWFLPQSLKSIEPEIRKIARRTVDHMLSLGEEFDFARDVAAHYPLRVIMHVLGVPEEQEEMMLTMTQLIFGSTDPDIVRDLTQEERSAVFMEFFNYCVKVTQDRRQTPANDLASVIANARLDGDYINTVDAMGYYLIVATAGHDTTSSSTAGAIHALLENPAQLQKLQQNLDFIPNMVDESIRWVTPVKHFMRTAIEDHELRGTTIKSGESVMLLYPSGNRDEDVFDSPFEFQVDRRPNRHIAFGHGAHHCLGNLLAKLEMRILYEEMFKRVRSIELNGEARLIESSFVSGLKTLPLRVKAA